MDLRGAHVMGAYLSGADLSGAVVDGVSFAGSDLRPKLMEAHGVEFSVSSFILSSPSPQTPEYSHN